MAAKTKTPKIPQMTDYLKFPYPNSENRLADYEYFESLFLGNHFDAFSIRINDPKYNRAYNRLRYVMINFAGLVSKVVADLLFTEPPTISLPDGDQEWLEVFVQDNSLDIQNYESALSNSYFGDAVYKLRIGKRRAIDDNATVIVEDTSPTVYFPEVDKFNVRAEPNSKEFAWLFTFNDKKYLRREVHTMGKIYNQVLLVENGTIMAEVQPETVGVIVKPIEDTKVKESLIIHMPNWKTGRRHFGISDYYDLASLFYSINNRMTKIDGTLDKHSDPLLIVPEGILDEKGEVKKEHLGVIEMKEGEEGKPQYVVWDANLDSAFKQIDKLVESLFMVAEISPDILGMGKGQAESGRALKLKLLRTIAKARRKRAYYDQGIKQMIYTAQVLAKAWNVGIGPKGLKLKKEAMYPEIAWQDGLPIDLQEQLEQEEKAIDIGVTSEEEAMMRVYGYDEKTAKKKAKEIRDNKKVEVPTPGFGKVPPFGKPGDANDKNKANENE